MRRCHGAILGFVMLAQLGGGIRNSVPPVTSAPTTPLDTVVPSLRHPPSNPAPAVPPVTGPSVMGNDVWVPSRIVPVPGEAGGLVVPGHWERRIGPHETYMPPLTATTPDGRTVTLPGGVVRSPDERQSP